MWKSFAKIEKKSPVFPRERQKRWDAENLRTVSTKMIKEERAILCSLCEREKVSVYELLRRLVRQWMMEEAARHPEAVEAALRDAERP